MFHLGYKSLFCPLYPLCISPLVKKSPLSYLISYFSILVVSGKPHIIGNTVSQSLCESSHLISSCRQGHHSLTQEERQQGTLKEEPLPNNCYYPILQYLLFNYFCQFLTISTLYAL